MRMLGPDCLVPSMTREGGGPTPVSKHCPLAGPGVIPWIHIGGELQNSHCSWRLATEESAWRFTGQQYEKVTWSTGDRIHPLPEPSPLSFHPSKTAHPIAVSYCPTRGDLVLGLPPIICFLSPSAKRPLQLLKNNCDSFLSVCFYVCGFTFSFLFG